MVYQGSKSRVAKDICPIIQKAINESNCDTFVDAFVGGANLIQHIKCKNRIGYDINPYLIALLNNLDKIPNFEVPVSKEEYDICRAEWRSTQLTHPDWYIGAVGYIASFGGRFYDGGYAKDISASDPKRHEHRNRKNNILKQMPELIGCKFEVKDSFLLIARTPLFIVIRLITGPNLIHTITMIKKRFGIRLENYLNITKSLFLS